MKKAKDKILSAYAYAIPVNPGNFNLTSKKTKCDTIYNNLSNNRPRPAKQI